MSICTYVKNGDHPKNPDIGSALAMLKVLKSRISEVRIQCENLKKLHANKEVDLAHTPLICKHCGSPVMKNRAVTVKDSFGRERSYFHNECFRMFWLSKTI